MAKEDKLSEELQDSLKDIITLCENEDDEIRKQMMKVWKKHEEFWHGAQHLFWNARDTTWRSPTNMDLEKEFEDEELAELGSFYDYVVDIFKAHGESIIAALAAQVPALRFLPDDADDDDDVQTARTYNKIGDLVQRHNKAKLLFLRALFYLYVHGVVFSYRYKDSDFKYGSHDIPKYGTMKVNKATYKCPDCEYEGEQAWEMCPQCSTDTPPKLENKEDEVPTVEGTEAFPKTRVKVEVYGALHIKVPRFARNQDEFDYLGFYTDVSKNIVQDAYPDFYDEIDSEQLSTTERFTRSEYSVADDAGIEAKNNVTVMKWWLRRSAFSREKDKRKREALKKKFPDGAKVTLVGKNKVFLEAIPEKMDDRWESGQAGLGTFFLDSDAMCRPVVPIQEMKNQVCNLTIETLDHGIPSTFADPKVLSFDQYGKFESAPGFVYKAVPRTPTAPISNSFYTMDRATLSKEAPGFDKQLDQSAQFALGSFPSIYGGPAEGKTRTYGEYEASRQMALQRLSIVWAFITDWWARTIHGAVTMYSETIVEDEHYTQSKDGSYINVWIRQAELNGKVGGVEAEGSEGFPVSLMQKKNLLMKLMEMQNPHIDAALYTPDNARMLQDVMALNEFKIPGEIQRVKQVVEINDLIKGTPVPIDPDIDDDQVHISTLKTYLADTVGLDLKKTNPAGYAACIEHLHEHQQNLMLQTLQAAPGAPVPGQAPVSADSGGTE